MFSKFEYIVIQDYSDIDSHLGQKWRFTLIYRCDWEIN
jgi:hypothetical protein